MSILGIADFAVISLYQLGVIRRLPDPPGRLFDSNRVNASHHAFSTGVPDGPLGVLLDAGTLVLAAAYGRSPRASAAGLLALSVAGSVGALSYFANMARQQERACPYCIGAGLISFAMLPDAVAEVRDAFDA